MKKNPHAVILGRRGGRVGGRSRSPAKLAAARANGAKGGRPKKQPDPLVDATSPTRADTHRLVKA